MEIQRSWNGLDDQELWRHVSTGDSDAFGEVFDRHATAVYNHLFRRTANWAEAEDLTSAVFLLAWRKHRDVVIDRASSLPWLLGVANRVLLNARRAERRYRSALSRLDREAATTADHADGVATAVDDERRMAELRAAVDRLPHHERDVIELCVWSGLDHQAAAVALGVPVGTVKSRLHRARRRLGAAFADSVSTSSPRSPE
jgi:RNA polymerase sigma-70 factor (ECF subfamily)